MLNLNLSDYTIHDPDDTTTKMSKSKMYKHASNIMCMVDTAHVIERTGVDLKSRVFKKSSNKRIEELNNVKIFYRKLTEN